MATDIEVTSKELAIHVDPNRERLLREAEKELPLEYSAGWSDPETYFFKSGRGVSRETVEMISRMKNEPAWMLDRRIKSYDHFLSRKMPSWGADLSEINFDEMYYYIKPASEQGKTWDDVQEDIKNTLDRLRLLHNHKGQWIININPTLVEYWQEKKQIKRKTKKPQ